MDESLTSMQWLNGIKSKYCAGSKAKVKEIRRSTSKAKTRQVAWKLKKIVDALIRSFTSRVFLFS